MRFILVALVVMGLFGTADAGRGRSAGSSGTGAKASSTSVRGYTTKRGTYVAPYRRTTSDGTQKNNYSTKNNTNPYTGKRGTKPATR